MKMNMILYLVISLIVLNSCSDIIKSDPNISKTKVEYNFVVDNQENGVLMPLKVGNLWIYKVTTYRPDGSVRSINFDSVLVKTEINDNNEKWFLVGDPQYNESNPVILTNTDKGLWMKCPECNNKSLLMAQFPVKDSKYFIGWYYLDEIKNVDDIPQIVQDTVELWAKIDQLQNYSSLLGTYNCIKYTNWIESRNEKMRIGNWRTDYFVPDLGKIRSEQYHLDGDTSYLQTLYELVYTNLKNDQKLKQITYIIDFDTLNVGTGSTRSADLLVNDTSVPITVYSITISGPDASEFTINPPSLPFVMQPGYHVVLKIRFQPVHTGESNATMTISTSAGNFEVQLKGTGK